MRNDVIYRIDLPEAQDAEAFLTFLREEYFPAVYMGPSRVGEVLGIELWQEDSPTRQPGHSFFLHVRWAGLGGEYAQIRVDEGATRRLESFGAELQRLGLYQQVATVPQRDTTTTTG